MSNELARAEKHEVSRIQPTQEGEAGALMTIIERISTMPDLDLDRVERLFDMHQKMVDRQQEQAFNDAMARAQSEIQGVVVNKVNSHTRSKYANIEAIHLAAKPIWTNHGFSVLTRSAASDIQGHVRLFTEVRHSGGHKVCYQDDWPLDLAGAKGNSNKTAIQGKGSTITYARRYTELMIFDIAIKEEDTDGNAPPAQQIQQQPEKQPLTDARLDKAIERIKAGEYTVQRLHDTFKLTAEQITKVEKETSEGAQ